MSVSRNRVHFPRAIRPPFGLWTFGSGYDFKGIINKMKGEVKGGEKKARKGSQEKYPGHPWIILDTTFVPMGNPHDN
jgi:hypothetical protein